METVESKKSKERSPSFPFITLSRALERAQEFYSEEKRGAAPFGRAVMHWKYSETSSGALQTVAALKQYGLLDDVGGTGKARQLKLTDLAIRILLDQREDSTEREANIQVAARSPAVAEEVYAKWPELPKDTTLSHFLMVEKRFSDGNIGAIVRILKENHGFARLDTGPVQSRQTEQAGEVVIEAPAVTSQVTHRDLHQPNIRKTATSATLVDIDNASGAEPAELKLRHKGVAITVRFSEEPTREIMEYLERYFGFEKDNVAPAPRARTRIKLDDEQSETGTGEQDAD